MPGNQPSTITIDGVDLAYEEQGDGPPVVFVHGFSISSYTWRQVTRTLSRSHRTICIDLLGFGFSAKPSDESYTLARQAELLRGFMLEKGLQRAVLVGHSYGGAVCLNLLRQAQGLDVAGLLLVDTVCYRLKLSWFMRLLRAPVLGPLVVRLVPAKIYMLCALWVAYRRRRRIKCRTVSHYAGRLRSPGARAALIATARNMIPDDLDELIASYRDIAVPTLIVWGDYDWVIPRRHGERLSREIPGAELSVIEDCGHAPQEERPEATAEVVAGFLTGLE